MKTTRFLYLFLLLIMCTNAKAESLQGTVSLKGKQIFAPATIRILGENISTTSTITGAYRIDDLKPGNHRVEISFIGYKTLVQDVVVEKAKTATLDAALEETVVDLNAVMVLPDGVNPATFILNKTWDKAKKQYAAQKSFKVDASTLFSSRDFDIVSAVLPSSMRSVLLLMSSLAGYKGMVKKVLDNPDFTITVATNGTYAKKKYKWQNARVTRSTIPLTEKEKAYFAKKMSDVYDVFDEAYSYVKDMLGKKHKPHLKGSYSQGEELVYIVEEKGRNSTVELHITEESWNLLKIVEKDDMSVTHISCAKAVGQLYLPVSINSVLKLWVETPKQLREHMEKNRAKYDELSDKEKQKQQKKASKVQKRIGSEKRDEITNRMNNDGVNISLSFGENLRYHN